VAGMDQMQHLMMARAMATLGKKDVAKRRRPRCTGVRSPADLIAAYLGAALPAPLAEAALHQLVCGRSQKTCCKGAGQRD